MIEARNRSLEGRIARLLTIGTYVSATFIAVGVVTMVAAGRTPLDVAPAFDPVRLPADLLALQPAAFLWLGILGILATPASRVVAALVGFLRLGERDMALVAGGILAVIVAGVISGTAAG